MRDVVASRRIAIQSSSWRSTLRGRAQHGSVACKPQPLDPSEAAAADEVAPATLPPLPDFGLLPDELSEEVAETPQDRIARWQRKLLDLSLRNRLLNYRDSKQTLPLRCPDVGALEDALAAGKTYRGLSLKDDDPLGSRTPSPEEVQRIEEEVVFDAFERRQLAVPLTGQEMNARLLTLYRRARSDMQEGGTNTLFLAAGFLRWEEDRRRYAFLPRAPCSHPGQARAPFRPVSLPDLAHEDDVQINLTLLEFLKRDFDLRIPELEGELRRDESGIDLPYIFEALRRKVRDIAGFEVVEELALSTFSFAKYLMWKDLVDRADQLRTNRLVKHLIDGVTETYEDSGSGAPLSRRTSIAALLPGTFCSRFPRTALSSPPSSRPRQGRDFVLIGPPGTGKSQDDHEHDRAVLGHGEDGAFVARRRRRSMWCIAGWQLMAFPMQCLNFTRTRPIGSRSLRSSDEAGIGLWFVGRKWIKVTEDLKLSRDRLNAYVDALHAKGSAGLQRVRGRWSRCVFKAAHRARVPLPRIPTTRRATSTLGACRRTRQNHAAVGAGPPLSLVRGETWSYRWEADLLESAADVRSALGELRRTEHTLAREFGLRPDPRLEAVRRERLRALAPRTEKSALDVSSVPDMSAEQLTAAAEAFATDVKELAAATPGQPPPTPWKRSDACHLSRWTPIGALPSRSSGQHLLSGGGRSGSCCRPTRTTVPPIPPWT